MRFLNKIFLQRDQIYFKINLSQKLFVNHRFPTFSEAGTTFIKKSGVRNLSL